eukprot:gene16971-19341_t
MTITTSPLNSFREDLEQPEDPTEKKHRKWYEKHPRRLRNYAILFSMFAVYMTVSVTFFTYYENWDPSIALAYVIETMTSVGYGYHTPSDDNSRLFAVIVMIAGVFGVYGGLSTTLSHRLNHLKKKRSLHLDNENIAASFKDIQKRLGINIICILGSLFLASGIFVVLEDWTYAKALYFAVQTVTTVGYGDIPLNEGGTHAVVMFYTFSSTIMMAFAIRNVRSLYRERKQLKKSLEFAEKQQTLDKLKLLDTGNGVPRDTFILAVLEQLGVLDRDTDIQPWIEKFAEYDMHNTGLIRREDIENLAVEQNQVGIEHAERIHNVDESVVAMIPDIRGALAQFSPITSPVGSFSHSNVASYLSGRQSASGNRGSNVQESPMMVLNTTSTGALSTSLSSSLNSTSTVQEMQGQL